MLIDCQGILSLINVVSCSNICVSKHEIHVFHNGYVPMCPVTVKVIYLPSILVALDVLHANTLPTKL
jgi:hypothetical protein